MVPRDTLCKNALRYRTANRVGYHTAFTYCYAMDQVKQGSKTLLNLFQKSLAKNVWPNKGLDSPTLGPSTNDPSYATSSSEMDASHYLRIEEKSSVP